MKQTLGLVIVGAILISLIWADAKRDYQAAYDQGRKDKHAEMMEFISGDPTARIAIVSKKGIEYNSAGICAVCHDD